MNTSIQHLARRLDAVEKDILLHQLDEQMRGAEWFNLPYNSALLLEAVNALQCKPHARVVRVRKPRNGRCITVRPV